MGIGKKKEHEKYACLDSLNDSISDNKKKNEEIGMKRANDVGSIK
jgi:hypothetical protein